MKLRLQLYTRMIQNAFMTHLKAVFCVVRWYKLRRTCHNFSKLGAPTHRAQEIFQKNLETNYSCFILLKLWVSHSVGMMNRRIRIRIAQFEMYFVNGFFGKEGSDRVG